MKFNVGDIIVYHGDLRGRETRHDNEINREQIIISITDYRIYTVFLDDNVMNDFGVTSAYRERCKIVRYGNKWSGSVLKFRFI